MHDEAAQILRKLSKITDEWKRNRARDCPHINAPASSSMKLSSKLSDEWKRNRARDHPHINGEVAPASPRMKLSKLRKWDVTAPLTCTQNSVFEGFVTEVSKSSLEKWNQGKKKSSRESRWDVGGELENNAEMEITQFDSLPEDLRVEILSFLPLPKLLQLRLVCKSWYNGLLRSPSMWESWVSRQHCWLVMVRKEKQLFAKEFIAYCITNNPRQVGGRKTGHWMSLSPLLESLQVSVHVGGKKALRVACRQGGGCVFSLSFCLVAGGQGHICFMVENLKQAPPPFAVEETLELHGMVFDRWRSPTPLIVNVLTGATKILPPPQSSCFRSVLSIHLCMTFLANANNTGYYVVLYDRECFIYVEVYSSDTGSWRTVLDCHTPSIHFPVTTDVQSGDLFWFLDGDCAVNFPCNVRYSQCINGILAYNVQADAWSKVSVDFPPDAYGAYALITKHKGRLVLVDLVDSPKSRYPREIMGAVGIWVMQV